MTSAISRRFIQCDVFSPYPTQGNALAVVVDADGLSDESMQRFAAWTNLAETTFLLPPEDDTADYKVRIFTPSREMLFAGHPTLGSCAAWLQCGGKPANSAVVRQECGIGIVEIDISQPEQFAFLAPPTQIQTMTSANHEAITAALNIPPEAIIHTAQLNNGPVWQVFELATAEHVLALDSSAVRWPAFQSLGFIGKYPSTAECDYEVRMLAPSSGMSEDPITGSLNSALAHWLQSSGKLQQAITVAQGTVINRHGRVFIRATQNNDVFIGGHTHILIQGTVSL
jgi:PhzF family phenazine biosynthesis protein